jgi:hypothetical protein
VINPLAVVLTTLALVAAAGALALVIANRPLALRTRPTTALLALAVLLEVGLIGQAVIGVVELTGTTRSIEGLTFVGYLIGPVVVLPVAAVWGLTERTRFGPAVLAVGCVSIPVMILRLTQIWAGHA